MTGRLYPLALIVIASYYILFAVIGGSQADVQVASLLILLFAALAIVGFRSNLWLVVGGLAAHGLLDLVYPGLVGDGGMPPFWPAFCLAYDVAAAACLAILLIVRPTASPTVSPSP